MQGWRGRGDVVYVHELIGWVRMARKEPLGPPSSSLAPAPSLGRLPSTVYRLGSLLPFLSLSLRAPSPPPACRAVRVCVGEGAIGIRNMCLVKGGPCLGHIYPTSISIDFSSQPHQPAQQVSWPNHMSCLHWAVGNQHGWSCIHDRTWSIPVPAPPCIVPAVPPSHGYLSTEPCP